MRRWARRRRAPPCSAAEEEAIIIAFRRYTLLPLDDCLYALQPTFPHLTRSSLHRCLKRHGIARLPDTDGDKPHRSRFKAYPIGFFHMDIAEVQTEEGRLYLFVAIDRTTKFAFAQFTIGRPAASPPTSSTLWSQRCRTRIHTVLTDNGTQFVDRTPVNEAAEAAAEAAWAPRASRGSTASTPSTMPANSTASSIVLTKPRPSRGPMARSSG